MDTSSGDDTPFRIANTSKKTALYRRAADFSPVIEEDSFENTTGQTNNFVLQLMFNKGGNNNKFQIEAWTREKRALKSLKKLNKPSKAPNRKSERAAQIEAALRKCNLDILNKINSENSVVEIEKQMNNPFDVNKDKADPDDTTKDMKDSKSGLSSRIESPSPG
ncbi:hypothetical protein G9A89_001958 [Geosiphon pyriformis]|nr:hypothetical protein G9A89_001958 [Geosiphon pyriformis]